MLAHDFLAMNKIPDLLPISTLVCPPSSTFTKQFVAESENKYGRLEQTAPVPPLLNTGRPHLPSNEMMKRIESHKGIDMGQNEAVLMQTAREQAPLLTAGQGWLDPHFDQRQF